MHIIPIASGKGGVGKSLVAANLAIVLAQSGKRVVLIDLDLGGSNLHLILGMRTLRSSIGTFIGTRGAEFQSAIHETDVPNLQFIPGDSEIPGLANLTAGQKRMLVSRIRKLEADVVVVDLGAGTNQTIVDFFLISGRGIVVTAPTPTATVNAYVFLKNSVFRLLQTSIGTKGPGKPFLDSLMKNRSRLQSAYLPQIAEELAQHDPEAAARYRDSMNRFHPRLVMNMIEDPKDAETVQRLRRSAQQYLDLELLHLGVIYRDDLQDKALASGLPIVRYKPASILSQAMVRIAEKVVQLAQEEDDNQYVDLEAINDSFDAASSEAEADFETKLSYIEELLNTGALSTGDLVETIKSQHFEIVQLRKQNNLYKSKLVAAIQQGFRA